jgi:hypothetical protein
MKLSKVSSRVFFFAVAFPFIVLLGVSLRITTKILTLAHQEEESREGTVQRSNENSSSASTKALAMGAPSFVTVVMPSVVKPQDRLERLKAISETWGSTARALYVVHDLKQYQETVDSDTRSFSNTNTFPLPLLIPSDIPEDMGVDRLQYVITSVLNHKSQPDYAFFVNDHTFVIPEHLCLFLSKTKQVNNNNEHHLYAGHAMIDAKAEYMFNSGASGYVLSRRTMQVLVDVWSEQSSFDALPQIAHPCHPPKGQGAKWFQGNPGLIIARCLHHALKVNAIDTRDRTGSGCEEHIFHAFGLVREVTGKVDQWYRNKHRLLPFANHKGGDEESIKELLPSGIRCCASHTISFHYVYQAETRALHNIRRWIMDGRPKTQARLEQEVRRIWPYEFKSLGGYAHGLPKASDPAWEDIVRVLRKISEPPVIGFEQCWNLSTSF